MGGVDEDGNVSEGRCDGGASERKRGTGSGGVVREGTMDYANNIVY